MTPKFHEEWRTIDPENPRSTARHYDNGPDARAHAGRNPWMVVQKRLVSNWEADQ